MRKKILSLFPKSFVSFFRFHFQKYIQDKKNTLRLKNKNFFLKKYGKVSLNEIFFELKKLGLKKTDVIFFQNSFDGMYNINFKPIDLLNKFFDFFAKSGGIFVPSFSKTQKDQNWIFDSNKEFTYTGVFNEIFRRHKKTIRSLHPRHSICGFGKFKLTILKDHHKCKYACGKGSPFDRLRKLKNSKIITLGLPKGYISFLHWMDDINPKKFLPILHENTPVIYKYFKKDNLIGKIYDYQIKKKYSKKLNYKKLIDRIPQDKIIFKNYKGIKIGIYEMYDISKHLINLKKNKISMYE